MLSLDFIRANPEQVKEACRLKGEPDVVDEIVTLDERRRSIIKEVEDLRAERNKGSKEVGKLRKEGKDASALQARLKEVSEKVKELDGELSDAQERLDGLLLNIPNVPHESVPKCESAGGNEFVREWGRKPELGLAPRPHYDICKDNGMLDLERGTKISGSFWPCYVGWGARLERALLNFMTDMHREKHGYREVFPPFLVNRDSMVGTGQLPKLEEDMYRLESDDLFLIPTAEVPVTNLHRDEILPVDALPIKYCAYSACFRREAGAYGKDTRGLIRVHQFNKVEMVKFTHPDTSYDELDLMLQNAEDILQALGLHYRVMLLAAGDMSFQASKCYDIEIWAPGVGRYLEVSSCSNCEAFQARRMNCRFRDHDGKVKHVHTLNGSGVALPRLFVALVETYQNEDGGIRVPEPLRPYLGGTEVIPAAPPPF